MFRGLGVARLNLAALLPRLPALMLDRPRPLAAASSARCRSQRNCRGLNNN